MKRIIRRQIDCTAGRNIGIRLRSSWMLVPFIMVGLLLTSCSSAPIDAESHVYRIALITPVGSKSVSDAVQFGAESAARELGAELVTVEMTMTARDTPQEYGAVTEASSTKKIGNSDSVTAVPYTDLINVSQDVQPQANAEEQSAQAAAVAHALELGATAIILNPIGDSELEQSMREIATVAGQKGKGIPVISLDARQVQGITSNISMDHRAAGRQAGQAMGELLEGTGSVLLLGTAQDTYQVEGQNWAQKMNQQTDQNTDQNTAQNIGQYTYQGTSLNNYALAEREGGVREILHQQYPQLQIESQLSCQDESSCQMQIEQWPHVQCAKPDQQTNANRHTAPAGHIGIIALDESASIAAARSVAEYCSSSNRIPIVGFGSEREQLEQLQEGIIRGLVVHNGFSAGYLGVQQAIAYLNGEQVQSQIALETRMVSTENMFWMDNQKLLFPFVQ
ncbi:D-ribose transporter subunit RbsB [compost metagenome]